MKKSIIATFALCLVSFATIQATRLNFTDTYTISERQEKVPVRPEDLPEAVKTTLSGDTYAGWQIATVFLVTKEDNSQYFEISLKKGEEASTINLDKDGKKVE